MEGVTTGKNNFSTGKKEGWNFENLSNVESAWKRLFKPRTSTFAIFQQKKYLVNAELLGWPRVFSENMRHFGKDFPVWMNIYGDLPWNNLHLIFLTYFFHSTFPWSHFQDFRQTYSLSPYDTLKHCNVFYFSPLRLFSKYNSVITKITLHHN